MRKLFALVWMVLGLCWSSVAMTADGALRIDISKGGLEAMPIAIPAFTGDSTTGQKIVDVVIGDLERSGMFKALDPKSFLQNSAALMRDGPNYREWQLVGAEALVAGAAQTSGGQLTVDFYVYDVYQGKLFREGKRFSGTADNWRYLAHRVADEIYAILTGAPGNFASRIAFIAEKGGQKWLAIMDQDGVGRTELTRGGLALTPRFLPDGSGMMYVTFERDTVQIMRWDLRSGQRTVQSSFSGLNMAPAITPDGTRMAMTLSKDGNPEIYVKGLPDGQLVRLTDNNAIDTSPSWSPDGQRIAFNSDRAGSPQVYVMDASPGATARRITFEGPYNSAPAWSPTGDLIAFVHGGGGKFRIALIPPGGGRMRVITDSWMDESPTWSPNGRTILFSRQSGSLSRLYTVDVSGHNERPVPMEPGVSASDPTWSPVLR
jgi:TolB protein